MQFRLNWNIIRFLYVYIVIVIVYFCFVSFLFLFCFVSFLYNINVLSSFAYNHRLTRKISKGKTEREKEQNYGVFFLVCHSLSVFFNQSTLCLGLSLSFISPLYLYSIFLFTLFNSHFSHTKINSLLHLKWFGLYILLVVSFVFSFFLSFSLSLTHSFPILLNFKFQIC